MLQHNLKYNYESTIKQLQFNDPLQSKDKVEII